MPGRSNRCHGETGPPRRARVALAMDTLDMTFDPSPTRRAFPDLPNTDMPTALEELLA
jgi:hypothetical protein